MRSAAAASMVDSRQQQQCRLRSIQHAVSGCVQLLPCLQCMTFIDTKAKQGESQIQEEPCRRLSRCSA